MVDIGVGVAVGALMMFIGMMFYVGHIRDVAIEEKLESCVKTDLVVHRKTVLIPVYDCGD